MKFGIKEEYIEKINAVFAAFPEIEEVVLYGSRAKGNYKKGSDIDMVITGGKADFKILNKITGELDDLLLPYQIDLALFDLIENEDLLEHIKRVGIVFYSKSLH